MKEWRKTTAALIRGRVTEYFDKVSADFLHVIGVSSSAYYSRLKSPETIRLGEFRRMTKVLHLSDEEVLRIVKG
ncbi:MAG: hypothetical protein Q4B15_07895 [Lachnospiraceae bacterium]|nr:hypothetical protein [Lachnospiraceae bacterium]